MQMMALNANVNGGSKRLCKWVALNASENGWLITTQKVLFHSL